jgi:hypothetical protein
LRAEIEDYFATAPADSLETIIKVSSKTELRDRCRFDMRFFISSATLSAAGFGALPPRRESFSRLQHPLLG